MTRPGRYPAEVRERGGPDGVRARAGPLVAVGNDQLDRLEVRDDAGDVTEVGCDGLRSTAAHGRGRRRRSRRGCGSSSARTVSCAGRTRILKACAVPLTHQAAFRSYSWVSPPSTGRLTIGPDAALGGPVPWLGSFEIQRLVWPQPRYSAGRTRGARTAGAVRSR